MKTNVLELWCEFKNQQGGTIHQCLNEYPNLSKKEQGDFFTILLDNFENITDKYHVRDIGKMYTSK